MLQIVLAVNNYKNESVPPPTTFQWISEDISANCCIASKKNIYNTYMDVLNETISDEVKNTYTAKSMAATRLGNVFRRWRDPSIYLLTSSCMKILVKGFISYNMVV